MALRILIISIIYPNSVTLIGNDAFACCSSLKSVTIPKSVTTIESQAFYNCSSLTSITIPKTVTTIESQAFEETYWLNNNKDSFVIVGDGILLQ